MQLHRRINITITAKANKVYHQQDVPVYYSSNNEGVYVYWKGFYSNENADFGITAGSLYLEETLCDGEFSIGQLCASRFEVQCFNLHTDLAGCEIIVTCTDTETEEEKPIFRGIIDSSSTDNFGDYRDIIAYDLLYTLRDMNVGEWWDNFWANRPDYSQVTIPVGSPAINNYYELIDNDYVLSTDTVVDNSKTYYYNIPVATIGQLRTSLCTAVGLNCETTTLVNDDIQIKQYMTSASPEVATYVTFGDLMSMICEINGVIGHINREGIFEYVELDTTSVTLGAYEKANVNFEDYTTEAITGIDVYESSDNLMYSYNESGNTYIISGNIFTLTLDSYDILDTICSRIYNKIRDITYIPCSIPMVVSDLDLNVGNKITSDRGTHYILSQIYSGSLFVEQTINCPAYGEVLSQIIPDKGDVIIINKKYSALYRTQEEIRAEVVYMQGEVDQEFVDVRASLALKVDKDDNDQIISMINASADNIILNAKSLIFGEHPNGQYIEVKNFEDGNNNKVGVTFDGTGYARFRPQEQFIVNNLNANNNLLNEFVMANEGVDNQPYIVLKNYDHLQNFELANAIEMDASLYKTNTQSYYNQMLVSNYGTGTGTSILANRLQLTAHTTNSNEAILCNYMPQLTNRIANRIYLQSTLNGSSYNNQVTIANRKTENSWTANQIVMDNNQSKIELANYCKTANTFANLVKLDSGSYSNEINIINYKHAQSTSKANELVMHGIPMNDSNRSYIRLINYDVDGDNISGGLYMSKTSEENYVMLQLRRGGNIIGNIEMIKHSNHILDINLQISGQTINGKVYKPVAVNLNSETGEITFTATAVKLIKQPGGNTIVIA